MYRVKRRQVAGCPAICGRSLTQSMVVLLLPQNSWRRARVYRRRQWYGSGPR